MFSYIVPKEPGLGIPQGGSLGHGTQEHISKRWDSRIPASRRRASRLLRRPFVLVLWRSLDPQNLLDAICQPKKLSIDTYLISFVHDLFLLSLYSD